MAIPLTSESAPAALINGDQMLSVELREAEDAAVEGGMVASGTSGLPDRVAGALRTRSPQSGFEAVRDGLC